MQGRLFLVEDDPSIREVTALGLEREGFAVATEGDGRRALERIQTERFDAILLDVMLPSLDGLELCREIRHHDQIPIVMLTARTDTTDVVVGLECGADDYVTKPFDMAELVARIRAALRRAQRGPTDNRFTVGDLEIHPDAFKVWKRGEEIVLTATEFRLLLELVRHGGRACSRQLLLDRVWDYGYFGDSRVVDTAIKRLRHKIEEDPSSPRLIQTVRGVGYRLERT